MAQGPDDQDGPEVTPEMIEAGVAALLRLVPTDVAFPVGGEEEAVAAVLRAAIPLLRD